MKRIAILASGTGSNARKIIEHLQDNEQIEVALVASNRKSAKVLDMAADHGITTRVITRSDFYESATFITELKNADIDWIILAGFLWLVPTNLISAYVNRIVNIHPALLPAYGGKGMYGMNVHKAVKENSEIISGITIHLVNENYDEGAIIFQGRTDIESNDTAEEIAAKVLKLEHEYYPMIVEGLVMAQANVCVSANTSS